MRKQRVWSDEGFELEPCLIRVIMETQKHKDTLNGKSYRIRTYSLFRWFSNLVQEALQIKLIWHYLETKIQYVCT